MSDKNSSTKHESTSSHHDNLSPLAKRFLWADSKSSVGRVMFWLAMLCVFLFVLDFIVHRHAYAPGEGLPGFYAVVGFVAFTLIVLGASKLRGLILRDERYYSPNSVDAEHYPEKGLERLTYGSETDAPIYYGITDEGGEGTVQDLDNSADSLKQKKSDQGDST